MSSENEIQSRAPQKLAAKPFQILCLSGGGYRGLYTAALLEKTEKEAGKPLSQVFDLIAGTSIDRRHPGYRPGFRGSSCQPSRCL